MKINGLPSEEFVAEICAFGQGTKTCSFLVLGPDGLECSKGTGLEKLIRQRREAKSIRAMGDNCSGPILFLVDIDR